MQYLLKQRRSFLADEQGLGKTIEALATIEVDGAYPAIVVCPASLKLNWMREIERWLPARSAQMLDGNRGAVAGVYVTVVNYDIVAGRRGCNIALTEPDAGSALTHLTTTAARDGDAFILNGHKSFLTGSNVNDLNATFVRFDDVPGAKGIGAVVVETSMPGVEIRRGPVYIGDRGIHHGDMVLTDVRVPA